MNELALFAGAGGGILGGYLLGWRTRCAVEIDPYARSVLLARQRDGLLPQFPVWDDVCTFDGNPWRGCIDVVSGGFPCQDISAAGAGAGLDGERSGLWVEMARVIAEVRPRYVYVENSPILTSRGLGRVLGDLAELGFDARWGVLSAYDAGLDHMRERIWIVADSMRFGLEGKPVAGDGYEASRQILARSTPLGAFDDQGIATWRKAQPGVQRMADGLAYEVDRLKAIGNGQVPIVAAAAWRILAG